MSYEYGDDLISQKRGALYHYYHYDGRGSVRQLTDFAGVSSNAYDYTAFGDFLAQTGSTFNPYLYSGEEYDANLGFYNLRARLYDPGLGRSNNGSGGGYKLRPCHIAQVCLLRE